MVDYQDSGDVAEHGSRARLKEIFEEAQRRGLIGRADLDVTVTHAAGFASGADAPPFRLVDLGSGGGVPGLVLAERWPHTDVWLVEGSEVRATFLRWAVKSLAWESRVTVLNQRAEEVGRRDDLRASFDMVTARGFGVPAVTAECAAPLLEVGGRLVVSEPPASAGGSAAGHRWSEDGLCLLGMTLGRTWDSPFCYQVLIQDEICPLRYPRRVGIPSKRPLF